MGNPPHSTLLGSRIPQRPGHTGTHGGLGQAGQGHEELPPPPRFRQQPGRTAMANRPPDNMRRLADLTRNHTKATMQTPAEAPVRDPGQQGTHPLFQPHAPLAPRAPVPPKQARPKRGTPAPNQARKDGRATTSQPSHPPPTHPANPDQASSSSSLPSLPAPQGDGASSSSSLPPPAPPPPEAYPESKKGAKVQQPFRNDHTGDWIWCEGTIQYRLRDLGPNDGVQIRVIWHRQKGLDQNSSTPDKPEGHILELNSAHPIRLRTDENKAHRGTKCTGELPPEWSQGLPPPRLPKRPPPGKRFPGPSPPVWRGKGLGHKPPQPQPAPTEATVNLRDLNHPAVTYSKDATTALQEVSMTQGAEWVPHLLTFQGQGLQRDDPRETTPIYTPDGKAYKCYSHKGTSLYARAGIHVHLVHHLSIPGRLGVYEVVGDGWQLNIINAHIPFGDATEPFLQAVAEAYRQMAMLAPTIIISNMNAAPRPADRGAQATTQDHAVRDTIEMLGLVTLTANLEGQPSHFPHQADAAPSRIDVCYGAPTTIIRAEARYGPLPLGSTGHSPLHIRLTIPNLPPSPPEDADQGQPPP